MGTRSLLREIKFLFNWCNKRPSSVRSECKSRLQFESQIICRLGKTKPTTESDQLWDSESVLRQKVKSRVSLTWKLYDGRSRPAPVV